MHEELLTLPFSDPVMIVLVLLTTALVVPGLSRLVRLPDIVGLILAGMLLGPHGLGILARDQVVGLFAAVGILSLMFIAGMEIDIRDFRKNRTRSMVFGVLTFFIPMVFGVAAGLGVLEMSIEQAVLLASLFASHTLLAWPVVSRLHISGDPAVSVAVGGTIITDVAALLVLSMVVTAHAGEMSPDFVAGSLARLVGFSVFVLAVLPLFAGKILVRLEGEGRLQFLFVFVAFFFSAGLAELAGIEPIIGAFMGGIALGRHIPPVSPLANRVEFFGNTIFVPAFLVSVGMLIDPGVFVPGADSGPVAAGLPVAGPLPGLESGRSTWLVALVMCGTVISAKWLAAWLAQRWFGWSASRRGVLFGLTVAQAAATLAAVMVGYRLGILDASVLNGAVIMVLVTAVISSLVVAGRGRQIADEQDRRQPEGMEKKRILIAVSSEATAPRILECALLLHNPESETAVRAVTIIDATGDTRKQVADIEKHLSRIMQDAVTVGHSLDWGPRIDTSPVQGVAASAQEYLASEIVLGFGQPRGFFGKRPTELLGEMAAQCGIRIFAVRQEEALAAVSRIDLVLPPGCELEDDFVKALESLKCFIRHTRAEIILHGQSDALSRAESVLLAAPALGGVVCRESTLRDLLRLSREGVDNGLLAVVLPRRESRGWTRETREIMGALDVLPARSGCLVMMPAADVRPVASGLGHWVTRLRRRITG